MLEAATLAEARRADRAASPDVILLDVHVGAEDGLELLDEVEALDLPSASCCSPARARSARSCAPGSPACSGSRSSSDGSPPPSPARIAPVGSPPMSVTAVSTPAEYEERLARYLFERSEEGRAVRVGEKETSEQAAIVERYRDLFSPAQLDVLREAEEAAERRRARAALPAAQDLRVRDRLGRAGRARGRAREPDPGRARRLARRGAAAADRAGEARRPARLRRPRRARLARERRQRALQRRPPRAARRRRGARGRALRRARRDRAQRARRRGSRCTSSSARSTRPRAPPPAPTTTHARALVREAARPGARGRPDLEPHELPPPALAARADVHEGARGRGLRRDAAGARPRHGRRCPGSGSTSTTGRRSRRAPA